MLEISWSELLILAIVTLVFVGPKELPVFLRTIGRYAGVLRRHASEFRAQFDAAMREAELDAMKEEMQKMQASVNAEVMGAEKALKEAGQATTLAPGALQLASAWLAEFRNHWERRLDQLDNLLITTDPNLGPTAEAVAAEASTSKTPTTSTPTNNKEQR